MLEKEELAQIRGVMAEVIASDSNKAFVRDVVVGVIASESTREIIRDVVVEAIGEAFEQVVLPRLDALENDMAAVKRDMVTVDYMENRLFAQKGEIANSGIKASQQVKTLATELHRNNVITADQFVLVTAG